MFHSILRTTQPVVVSLLIVIPLMAQRPAIEWNAPPEKWQWVIADPVPGMVHKTLKSKSMEREVGYNIYLPASYHSSPERHYPVVYYLHGASGSELSAGELGDVVRRLNHSGKLGDVIYVFPNGGHFSKYRDWESQNVKAETLVIGELIPHIDATYRTIAEREGRALAGWSMGGDAALRFTFKYPDMFCAAATIAAAIDWGAPPKSEDTIFAHSREHADKIRNNTGLLLLVGEADRLYASHRRLLPHLDSLKIDYEFESYSEIGHNLGQMKQRGADKLVLMLQEHYAKARSSDDQ